MEQYKPTEAAPYPINEISPGSFIFEIPNALPVARCEEMVRRFEEKADQQYPGRIGQMQEEDASVKRSTDLVVSGKPDWKDVDHWLFESLAGALRPFREGYPFFKGRFKDNGYAIQRTSPGEFYHWHIDGGSHSFADRQLVVVWYLNDVEGPGGETEFLYQKMKVKPEQGKMLLFPPFWTHEHRGVILEKGLKYLATTWVVFN